MKFIDHMNTTSNKWYKPNLQISEYVSKSWQSQKRCFDSEDDDNSRQPLFRRGKRLTQDNKNVSQVVQEVDMWLSRGDHNCKRMYVPDT